MTLFKSYKDLHFALNVKRDLEATKPVVQMDMPIIIMNRRTVAIVAKRLKKPSSWLQTPKNYHIL